MSFTIKKSNGTTLCTIADGTLDTTTALSLPGKNYGAYGQKVDNDLVYLLENFASTTEPSNPLEGQIWYDSSVRQLKVYNGSAFKGVATNVGSTEPTTLNAGDLW